MFECTSVQKGDGRAVGRVPLQLRLVTVQYLFQHCPLQDSTPHPTPPPTPSSTSTWPEDLPLKTLHVDLAALRRTEDGNLAALGRMENRNLAAIGRMENRNLTALGRMENGDLTALRRTENGDLTALRRTERL